MERALSIVANKLGEHHHVPINMQNVLEHMGETVNAKKREYAVLGSPALTTKAWWRPIVFHHEIHGV